MGGTSTKEVWNQSIKVSEFIKVRLSILLILTCCTPTGDTDETPPSVIQEPEIVPVTAVSVGNDSEQG